MLFAENGEYEFIGRKFYFSLGIVIMILPIVGSMPSAMQINKALGVYDNLFLNIITSPVGCFSGTNFLLMYGAFKSLPWDYAEAANLPRAFFINKFDDNDARFNKVLDALKNCTC